MSKSIRKMGAKWVSVVRAMLGVRNTDVGIEIIQKERALTPQEILEVEQKGGRSWLSNVFSPKDSKVYGRKLAVGYSIEDSQVATTEADEKASKNKEPSGSGAGKSSGGGNNNSDNEEVTSEPEEEDAD